MTAVALAKGHVRTPKPRDLPAVVEVVEEVSRPRSGMRSGGGCGRCQRPGRRSGRSRRSGPGPRRTSPWSRRAVLLLPAQVGGGVRGIAVDAALGVGPRVVGVVRARAAGGGGRGRGRGGRDVRGHGATGSSGTWIASMVPSVYRTVSKVAAVC